MRIILKALYFVYQWVIFMPLFLLMSITTALTVSIGSSLGNGNVWGYRPGIYWGKLSCWLTLSRVKVIGRENIDPNTSYVFVANHQGAFDIFLIWGFLEHDFKWMLRRGITKIPIIGQACKDGGHIIVDERGSKGMMATIRQALNTLKGGMSLVVFPEGTRTGDGHLSRFKRGAFQLAGMVKLPVVPVTLDGPYRLLKKGSMSLWPTQLTITIHKPLPAVTKEEGTEAGITRLLADSQRVIAESLGDPVQVFQRPAAKTAENAESTSAE